jgi:hypothetical protein
MIISPDLCYGSKGFYPLISANSALIMQVRFLRTGVSQQGVSLATVDTFLAISVIHFCEVYVRGGEGPGKASF